MWTRSTPSEKVVASPKVKRRETNPGIRNRSALANVKVMINNISLPALYADLAPGFTGLDQVNVSLILSLRGSNETNVVLTVDGQVSNVVTVNIK